METLGTKHYNAKHMKKMLLIHVVVFFFIACDTSPQGNNPAGKARANDTDQFNTKRTGDQNQNTNNHINNISTQDSTAK